MHINPDVLLSVNRFDRVVALEGLNEDGTALIDGYRAYGQEMKTVSDELADRAMELGYLSAGGQITLTVDSEKGDWKTAAEELLLLELEVHFEQRVTVTVDGRQPPAGQEPTEEIIIPSQPEEDPDKDDTDDDFDDDTQVNGAHDDNEDDGIGDDDDDDLDAAVSTSGDSEDEDEQDDTPPGFVSGDDDDDDTQDSDDDDLEAPDDADDSDPDDENGDD